MTSPKRIARIAGILYLLNGIFGAFALLFVDTKVYIPGDAAATARNLAANSELVRLGVVADLGAATIWIFLAMTLYLLLKHVHKSAASAMVVLVAIGSGIGCLNAVLRFEGLRVVTGQVGSAAFGAAGSRALALLLLDTQHYGVLVEQIFFGLWLAPLGYLAYKSGWFPKALGIALVVACVAYLVDLLVAFLVPDLAKEMHSYISILPSIVEPWMALYLLVVGVRTVKVVKTIKTDARIVAAM